MAACTKWLRISQVPAHTGTIAPIVLATWCTVAGRQRINANGFLTPYDLISWKKEHNVQNRFDNHNYVIPSILFRKPLTLFAPILLITSNLLGPPRPCPCCRCPSWALTAYLSRFVGGWAPLHPSSPNWPHLPQIPGNNPLPCQAQIEIQVWFQQQYCYSKLSKTSLIFFSNSTFCF